LRCRVAMAGLPAKYFNRLDRVDLSMQRVELLRQIVLYQNRARYSQMVAGGRGRAKRH
jgi:hypothetical protein